MNILTREELKMLAGGFAGPCISIFLPMHQAGADIQTDPIRLKNLLRQAEEKLKEEGVRDNEIMTLLEPIYRMFENNRLFWRSPSRGLAVFRSRDFFRYYRLPIDFDELTVVNSRFCLKPLLPLLGGTGRFYLLALCQDGARLLEGTRSELHEIQPEQMPVGLASSFGNTLFQIQVQSLTRTHASGERGLSLMTEQEARDGLSRYFRKLGRGIHDLLRNEGAPLLLAGAGSLVQIYRDSNTYPHLLPEAVTGSHLDIRSDEFRHRAWQAVEPYFRASLEKAVEQYNNAAGAGRASARLTEVIPAACHGRIDTLFLDDTTRLWGIYDPAAVRVHVVQGEQPGAEELSDFAAVQVILNGGMVYPMPTDNVPDGAPMAALFRY